MKYVIGAVAVIVLLLALRWAVRKLFMSDKGW